MMIYKITPSVDYNKGLKRLDTQLNEPTNQNLIKDIKTCKVNEIENITMKLWGLV